MRIALIAVGLSAFGGFGGLSVAAGLCLFRESLRRRVIPPLVSYAVGAVLGVALLDLLPDASSALGTRTALATTLAGIVTFFALEKLALWRHPYAGEIEYRPTAPLVLIGDSAHNLMDDALIGAAALVSVPLARPHDLGALALHRDVRGTSIAVLINGIWRRRNPGSRSASRGRIHHALPESQ